MRLARFQNLLALSGKWLYESTPNIAGFHWNCAWRISTGNQVGGCAALFIVVAPLMVA